MSMTAGKPILTYGKDPKNSQEIAEFLAPKYDVVHVCLLTENSTAKAEIPALLLGDAVDPACKIGSNSQRSADAARVPQAIIFGGAVPEDEVEAIKSAAEKVGVDMGKFKWLTVKGNKAAGPPSADKIAAKIREMLVEAGL